MPPPSRLLAGVCLIAAPLTFFAGTLVHPGLRLDAAEQIALIGAHRGAWYWTHLLGLAAAALFVPAILGLARLLRPRAPGWARAGAGLALVGFVGWAGIVAVYGFVGWQMTAGGDQAAMTDLFRRITEEPASALPLRALSFGVVAGMLVFAVALARTGTAPRWVPPLLGMGFVQFAVGGLAAQVWLLTLGTGAMTLSLGALGVRTLRGDGAVL